MGKVWLDNVVLEVIGVNYGQHDLLLGGGEELERFDRSEPLEGFGSEQVLDLSVQAELYKRWAFLIVHEIVHESDLFEDG